MLIYIYIYIYIYRLAYGASCLLGGCVVVMHVFMLDETLAPNRRVPFQWKVYI